MYIYIRCQTNFWSSIPIVKRQERPESKWLINLVIEWCCEPLPWVVTGECLLLRVCLSWCCWSVKNKDDTSLHEQV